jgi:hypothetical protein
MTISAAMSDFITPTTFWWSSLSSSASAPVSASSPAAPMRARSSFSICSGSIAAAAFLLLMPCSI